jgi:hypothetical protein
MQYIVKIPITIVNTPPMGQVDLYELKSLNYMFLLYSFEIILMKDKINK